MLKIIVNAVEVKHLELSVRSRISTGDVKVNQTVKFDPRSLRTDKPFVRSNTKVRQGTPEDILILGVLKTIYNSKTREILLNPGDVVYGQRKDIDVIFTKNERCNCLRTVEPSYALKGSYLDLPYETLNFEDEETEVPTPKSTDLKLGIPANYPAHIEDQYKSDDNVSYSVHKGIQIKIVHGQASKAYVGNIRCGTLIEAKQAIDQADYIVSLR